MQTTHKTQKIRAKTFKKSIKIALKLPTEHQKSPKK